MTFKIFHQLGHNYSWNFQSLEVDGTGDGVIISPRHMEYEKAINLPESIRNSSIFDPQFFLPSYAKGYLRTYSFFPDLVTGGFDTNKYAGENARESAHRCVEFQKQASFGAIVIPTRYMQGLPENYFEIQDRDFVEPFLEAISEQNVQRPLFVQLVLNDDMIKDPSYSASLLDWITAKSEISGVYLITELVRNSKQIKDIDFLYALLHFIFKLAVLNNMEVIAGYLNVESILLSIASPTVITMGSYENTRMFSIKNFEEEEVDKYIAAPNPRIYSPVLLQLVDHNYLGSISHSVKNMQGLFAENQYRALMFEPTYQWHFNKPELYKHYFLVLSRQLRQISTVSGQERYEMLTEILNVASRTFSNMDIIVFDKDSDGSHLPAWQTAANRFAQDLGWR